MPTVSPAVASAQAQVIFDAAGGVHDASEADKSVICRRPAYIYFEGLETADEAVIQVKPRDDAAWCTLQAVAGSDGTNDTPTGVVRMHGDINMVRVDMSAVASATAKVYAQRAD